MVREHRYHARPMKQRPPRYSAARLVIGTEAAIAKHPNAAPLASARADE